MIVKLPTADPGGRAVGQMMGLYERESRFYAELADTIGIRVPHCYVNVGDPADEGWALVLEDLAPLEAGDQVAGADVARARIVVERLARLHARFYGGTEVHDLTLDPIARRADDRCDRADVRGLLDGVRRPLRSHGAGAGYGLDRALRPSGPGLHRAATSTCP